MAIADKRRVDHSESAEIVELIGSVEGRTALIVDDFTISAGTLVDVARVLVERGALSVYAAVSHGLLAGPAIERLDASPIERLFMTDSVETQPLGLSTKVEIVSVAGLDFSSGNVSAPASNPVEPVKPIAPGTPVPEPAQFCFIALVSLALRRIR